MLKKIIFLFIYGLSFSLLAAEYQSQSDFLQQAFVSTPPKPKILWIKKDLKKQVEKILQHKSSFMRVRYWYAEGKTVWVMNETGKIKPITVAITIKDKKITLLKVLAFRESRGWEVKHDFFTDQFKDNTLAKDSTLSQPIDGISGATLSVRALTKLAQLALLFDSKIQHEE